MAVDFTRQSREFDWGAIRRELGRPVLKCCGSEPPCQICPYETTQDELARALDSMTEQEIL